MKKLPLLLLMIGHCLISSAQSWPDTLAAIEKLFSRYTNTTPGAELAISRNGQMIFSKAWGMADLEHNIPLTTTSPTEAGSVSKQFTAASILLLEQQGKLSLEDDVRKYIPELPDYGKVITLRHTMQHTSGLKDWGSIMDIAGWPRGTRNYSNEYALYVMTLQPTLNNAPGDEFIYSNSNYNLLVTIVERVSGMSLAAFTYKYIFEPAAMKHTEWRANYKKVVPNRALAYSRSGQQFFTNMPNENVHGHGGLLTTAEDLLAWNHFYLGGKFGHPSLLPHQTATRPLNNGRRNNYAAGLVIDSIDRWQSIAHTGATASYRAYLEYFPEAGLSIAWLSNTSAFDNDTLNLANAVRKLFLRDRSTVVRRQIAVPVAAEKLAAYAGCYRNPRTGAGIKLYVKDGKLSSLYPTADLTAISEKVFMLGNNRLELNNANKLLYITAGLDSLYYDRVDSAVTNEEHLKSYVGEYYSSEAEATYHIELNAGKLLLKQKPTTVFILNPVYKDGFNSPLGALYFVRDLKKGVIEFKISLPRARNVSFKKR